MRRFKTIAAFTRSNMMNWKSSYHIWVVLLAEIYIMRSFLKGFIEYAEGTDKTITVWLLPVLLSGSVYSNGSLKLLIFLGGLLIFCDAPFLRPHKYAMIGRCSRMEWAAGECLYLLAASFLYLILLNVAAIIILHPVVSVHAYWGRILGDYLKQPNLLSAYNRGLTLPFAVIETFLPESAFLYSLLSGSACLFFLGLLIFCLNLATGKQWPGILAAGLLILWDPVAAFLFGGPRRWMLGLSPVTWCSMEHTKEAAPYTEWVSMPYAAAGYAILIMVLLLVIRFTVLRKDLLGRAE